MRDDDNPSKQAEVDASPNEESAYVQGAPNANNLPLTASPNDLFLQEKSMHQLRVENLNFELARKETDNVRKQAISDRKLATVKGTVSSQRNRIAKLDADRKAVETELKAKLRSAKLAAKDNSVALLARVNGGKNELTKANRDLLDSTKSLSKALKRGSALGEQVLTLQLANKHLRDELADARLKLKEAAKESNDNKKQLDNQLEAKHQLRLSLAKIDLKKHRVSLSRELEKKRKHDDTHNHRLLEIKAREASSKRVKETAATHKTRIKEKALEAMMDTYQGTNLGQFPNGRTNLENVSNKNSKLQLVFSLFRKLTFDLLPFFSQTFTSLGLSTRITKVAPTPPPSAAAAPLRTHDNFNAS